VGLPIKSFVQVTWLISTSIVTAAKNKEVLLWKHRQKIALGAARGIRYLHEGGSSLSFTNVLTSVVFFLLLENASQYSVVIGLLIDTSVAMLVVS
jgi:hypothetical protein